MAIFAEVTDNECIVESTCATFSYPFTVTSHWHMYVVVSFYLKFVMKHYTYYYCYHCQLICN